MSGTQPLKSKPPAQDAARKSEEAISVASALGNRSIVLVGLMGAGKTTVGRRLANRLDLPFRDADTEIEKAAGSNIADIFKEFGEAHFRDGEQRVIHRLLGEGPQVLATGGGAFMNPKTREATRENGISVWLKADLDVLMKRVSRRSHRPLLQNDDPEAVMKRLIDERYPIYATADLSIESKEGPHDAVVDEIVHALAIKLKCSGTET
jgi:shikimate kinase|tara:strand:+ start:1445 stop:2068 length:624 start_codon:yes stop_codon:yes gene_type:complete